MSDLLVVSEKAAHIARACRKERDLFELLIEEKLGAEKNAKFSHDFKTLADVLIQETVRHDLGQKYPDPHFSAVAADRSRPSHSNLDWRLSVSGSP